MTSAAREAGTGGTTTDPHATRPSPSVQPAPSLGGRDRIVLTGVRARGRHGVLPEEREQGQDFVVDVTLTLDLGPASETDDLTRTVDYGLLAQAVAADVQGEPLDLIEALAGRVARTCLRQPGVAEVEVTVHKPQAPIPVPFTDVAVTLTRSRP